MTDDGIDTSDIPPMTDADFARSTWRLPPNVTPQPTAGAQQVIVEVTVDEDTLVWFQSQGQDYQNQMRAASHLYAEAHRTGA